MIFFSNRRDAIEERKHKKSNFSFSSLPSTWVLLFSREIKRVHATNLFVTEMERRFWLVGVAALPDETKSFVYFDILMIIKTFLTQLYASFL